MWFWEKPPPKPFKLPKRLPVPAQEFEEAPRPDESVDVKDPVSLGIFYHELNYLKLATYYFSIAASLGKMDGLFFYALSLRHGWGIEADPTTAVKLLILLTDQSQGYIEQLSSIKEKVNESSHKLALNRLALGIFELAMSFSQGLGVPKDVRAATYYLNMAAELGDVDAQLELAECYLRGQGVKRNKKQAAHWFKAAEAQGARLVGMQWIYKDKYS